MKNNFYINLLEFCYQKPQGFSPKEVSDFAKKYGEFEKKLIKKYIANARANYDDKSARYATPFIVAGENSKGKYYYTLTLEAFFNYIDYLELTQSRKNAEDANKHANRAIWVAIIAIIINIIAIIIDIVFQIIF